jgi:hypothetical protein
MLTYEVSRVYDELAYLRHGEYHRMDGFVDIYYNHQMTCWEYGIYNRKHQRKKYWMVGSKTIWDTTPC